jgi:hypothetical protein
MNSNLQKRLQALILRLKHAESKFNEYEKRCAANLSDDNSLDSEIAATAMAGAIQSIYTKTEEILKFIAKHIDNSVPSGDGWHADLLDSMQYESDFRCAVISKESFASLNKVRLFRHVVRNNYAEDLQVNLVSENIKICKNMMATVLPELNLFCNVDCSPKNTITKSDEQLEIPVCR